MVKFGCILIVLFTLVFNVALAQEEIDIALDDLELEIVIDEFEPVEVPADEPEKEFPELLENVEYFYPTYDDEYVPDASYSEIADRISCIESEMPLHFNETVNSFINYFTVRNREYTREVMRLSPSFFPIFESYIKKYDLPEVLKYLPVIESGLRPKARSWAAAVGLWQFIPSTGRIYDLHQDFYIDERMDPHQASDAACRHLKSLYRMFGDWELALAAYNCGAGNVRKAMRRSGYKDTFWEIYRYLPRETRSYLPQFIAVVYAFNYAEEHNFIFDRWEYERETDYQTIYVNGFTNLKSIAQQLNICYEDIDDLNPAIKYGAIPDNTEDYPVRIPIEAYDKFLAQKEVILDSASRTGKAHIEYLARNTRGSTWGRERVSYRVRYGDVLGTIAERYNVRVSDLRSWNNISGNLIKAGERIDIWVTPNSYSRTHIASSRRPQLNVAPNGSKFHIVQPGDTLWDISKTYDGLSIEKLKQLNNLKSSDIKPGQRLVIG